MDPEVPARPSPVQAGAVPRAVVSAFPLDRLVHGLVAYYALALVLLHLLQPDVSPVAMPTSAYVLGTGGILMTMTFFALAAALVATALGLRARLAPGWAVRAGTLFMVVGAVAVATAGVFPTDGLAPPTPPVTRGGWTHLIAGRIAFPCFLLGPLFLTLALRRAGEWRRRFPALAAVVGLLAVSVPTFVLVAVPNGWAGLPQRVVLALLLAWLALVATGFRTATPRQGVAS